MEKSETIGALAAALAKAQGAMTAARKDSSNPQFRSQYADLAAIVEAIRKPLADNELSYCQIPGTTPDGLILVETILMHSSGEWISGTLAMQPTMIKQGGQVVGIPPEERTPQVTGSCIQYARRYSLQSVVGIPADTDDDGNAASNNQPNTAAKPALQRAPERPTPKAADAAPANGTSGLMDPEQKKRIWGVWHTGLGWDMPKLERFVADTFDGKLIAGLTKAEAAQLLELLDEMMNMAAKEAK